MKLTTDSENESGVSQLIWTWDDILLESGASNIFFILKQKGGKKSLVTHPANGMVLPGVTRSSILLLAKDIDKNIVNEERPLKIQELMESYDKGEVEEIFMSGTAAVITQVDKILVRGKELVLSKDTREFSTRMKKYLLDIQRGRIEHEFCVKLK